MSIEAMKQALEALTKNSDRVTEIRMKADAIKALEEALAKQEQINSTTSMSLTSQDGAEQEQSEPVAWADHGVVNWIADAQFKHAAYLYTTPQPAQKPLTDEQIDATPWIGGLNRDSVRRFARAIEAAHGIGEKK